MNRQLWVDHLATWKVFLNERIGMVEEDGERIKCERQIRTLERVRCGAVLNPRLISEFISFTNYTAAEVSCDKYFFSLNESQKKAVNIALGDSVLTLIQGPPGTGKTQVIAELCLQLFQRNPGIRILVCSETHVAVNNLLSRIAELDKGMRIVRIRDKENDDAVDDFSPERIIESYLDWAEKSILNKDVYSILKEEFQDAIDDDLRRKNQLEKALSLSANIVGMTCNRVAAYDFRDTTEMFDIAIVDEVCKATLPEILSPMIIAKKAVLLGDPKQLPPVFCSEEQDVIKSIQNCNLNKFMYIDSLFENGTNVCVLDTQYRMTNQIGNMISELFYDGAIKNGRNEDNVDSLTWVTYTPSKKWPLPQVENEDKPEIYNDDECKIINGLLEKILEEKGSDTTVAIIAPYRAQVGLLRRSCKKTSNTKIDTVDGFQGKESDIVIFSVTRTMGSYRFLADERRLNVALSRAKDKIYIVGEKNYAEKEQVLKKIIERSTVEEYTI